MDVKAIPGENESGKTNGWSWPFNYWSRSSQKTGEDVAQEHTVSGPQVHTSGLPSALPTWASGTGFATGQLNLGEVSVVRITEFQQVWSSGTGQTGAAFYNPLNIPQGYHSLGDYAQLNAIPPRGWVLAISGSFDGPSSPLAKPTDYTLIWSSADSLAFFWAPVVPPGYKALGVLLTNSADKPGENDIALVREDLTDDVVIDSLLWDTSQLEGVPAFSAWTTKPSVIGLEGLGIPVNTFYCDAPETSQTPLPIACLKNVNHVLDLMPTFEQLNQVMNSFGPTVFCHPDEPYLPTTPEWFFENGGLLYSAASPNSPERIANDGSNLPSGGISDYQYWLDLPNNSTNEFVKNGDLSVAKVSVHVKPMFGAVFTDLSCWIYHTFNGSSVAKLGVFKSVSLGKIGEHVGDWEHFVLRVDNFSGELRRIYYGEHAAGYWYRPDEVEFVNGNRAVVYSAKNSHALYTKEGENLQGNEKIGVGIRNDTARSSLTLDSSTKFEFIGIDYLRNKGETGYPEASPWVDFMREWGPKITYDSKTEIDKILERMPKFVRKSLRQLIGKLPVELGGEEGPSGPKEKSSWTADERVF